MKRVSVLALSAFMLAGAALTGCNSSPKMKSTECQVEFITPPAGVVVYGTFGPDKYNVNPEDTLAVKGNKVKIDYAGKTGDLYIFLLRNKRQQPTVFAPQEGGVYFKEMKTAEDSLAATYYQMEGANLSEPNKAFNQYAAFMAQFQDRVNRLTAEAKGAPDSQEDSLRSVYKNMVEENQAAIRKFIAQNSNIAGAITFIMNSSNLMDNVEEVAPSIESCPKSGVQAEAVKQLNQIRAIATGSPFTDFALPSVKGDTLRLSDYAGKGKPVLLDFWASWCGFCRRMNPELVEMYKKYHGKGLEIFAVSLDKSKENWEKAIKDDNLPWIHVSSLTAWECPVRSIYMVSGIPTNFLLDGNGTIVARGLHGEELEQKVRELLK